MHGKAEADMTTNNKGRNGGSRATPRHYKDKLHYTKLSRINRKKKRGWKEVRK
jgi:hypothetical protein